MLRMQRIRSVSVAGLCHAVRSPPCDVPVVVVGRRGHPKTRTTRTASTQTPPADARPYGEGVSTKNAPSPEAVSAGLRRWLGERFGGEVTDVEAPGTISGGFDFWIYVLHLRGPALPARWTQPLVARIPPTPERFRLLEHESRLQGWCAEHGYPAPGVLAVLSPGEVFDSPAQVVERVPGGTMTDAMTKSPWRLPRLLDRMGALQAQLHALPVPDWATTGPDWSLAARRLGLVRFLLDQISHPELASGLEYVERLIPLLDGGERLICHGDFHPMNLLVEGARTSVIDWTDAGIGDRHGDIARTAWLFRFASVAAPRRAERALLRSVAPLLARGYLASYRRRRPFDPDRLRLWMPLHLLHAWAMLEADEMGLFGPSRAGHQVRPGLSAWARGEFLLSTRALP